MKCMSKAVMAEKRKLEHERRLAEEQAKIAAMTPEEYDAYMTEKEKRRAEAKKSLLNLARSYSLINDALHGNPYSKFLK